jgi:hypothetical protein
LTQGPQTPSTTTPKDTTGAIEQPPSANLAQQPKSLPDANSQCPTTGNQNPQSLANNNIIIIIMVAAMGIVILTIIMVIIMYNPNNKIIKEATY